MHVQKSPIDFNRIVALASLGQNIRLPDQLQEEPIGLVLRGIYDGRWAKPVTVVRKLNTPDAKEQLPFWTPAGTFEYRCTKGLKKHSGFMPIDLDDMTPGEATKAIQIAVADPYCEFAFRSVSKRGVRLGFPCPPCSPEEHTRLFKQIAQHVRKHYPGHLDGRGSDVCRACFVSWDAGLWVNSEAKMFPYTPDLGSPVTQGYPCVTPPSNLTPGDLYTLAYGLGESRAPHQHKPDGTAFTHWSLVDLARDLVVRFARHGLTLGRSDIDRAMDAWWRMGHHKELTFRLRKEAYLEELNGAIRCVSRTQWIGRVVNFWTRWKADPGFPSDGSSRDKLRFAIRQHCQASGTDRFFLSVRDASAVTDTCFMTAHRDLCALVRDGTLERVGKPLHRRHAQGYRLKEFVVSSRN